MKQPKSSALDVVLSLVFPRTDDPLTSHEVDWDEVCRIILGNRILGYTLERLNSLVRSEDIPIELTDTYRQHALANLLTSGEVLKINRLATASKTEVYFYKGSVWSQWLFEDIKMRSPGDIDLFVTRERLVPFIEILKQNGYTVFPYHEMLLNASRSTRNAFLNSDYHIPLQSYDSSGQLKSVVEVHWKIAYPRLCFDFDPEEFGQYAASLEFLHHTIPILSNEYQLLMLIVNHGGKEGWNRLKYVIDLKGYLDRYGSATNWDIVFRLASEKGISKLLVESLGLIRTLGYSWKPEFPEVKKKASIDRHLTDWQQLTPLPNNTSWWLFKQAMINRDPSHKLHIVKKHMAFLSDFHLNYQKLRWHKNK